MHSQSSTEGQAVQKKKKAPPSTAESTYKGDDIGTNDVGATPPPDGPPATDSGT